MTDMERQAPGVYVQHRCPEKQTPMTNAQRMTKRGKGRIGRDITYVHWQEDGAWLGYLAEYPDYMTQGASLSELRENLRDIYNSLRHILKKLKD